MKNSLRLVSLFVLILLIFAMSGCKFSVVSAEKLLRPPKSGIEIVNALEEFTGDSIILKNPVNSSSEYSSSLTLADLDYDGEEEAVVFYTTSSNDSAVHMNVLKQIGDEWVSIGDFSGYGNNVETISFRNLAKDTNYYDIVTTWSYIDSKVLTIHKIAGEGRHAELRLVSDFAYTSMGYVDIDRDGFYELFLINGDFADKEKVPTAKIIRIEKYSVLNIGMISLSREIIGYQNSHCQEIDDENIPMIAVYDYVNSDGLYGTDVVYWDTKYSSLSLMQVDSSKKSAFSTLRSLPILSSDVNADSFVDIPVQEPIVGAYTNDENSNLMSYTKWCSLIPNKDGLKLEQCCNYRLYFTDKEYFDVKDSLVSKISVVRDVKADSWGVISYNPEKLADNKLLVDIRNISQEDLDKYISKGYKQLSSFASENKLIVYEITKDGQKFGIQDRDLISIKL